VNDNTPTAPPDESQGFFHGIRPVAVALGALIDQISTMVLNVLLLGLIASDYESAPGVIDEDALKALAQDPNMLAAWLGIGTFCTGLGGFMGARMAGHHHARHGAFVGLAGVAMGLMAYAARQTPYPPALWYDLLSFGLLVPAGAIGGLLCASLGSRADPGAEAEPTETEPDDR